MNPAGAGDGGDGSAQGTDEDDGFVGSPGPSAVTGGSAAAAAALARRRRGR